MLSKEEAFVCGGGCRSETPISNTPGREGDSEPLEIAHRMIVHRFMLFPRTTRLPSKRDLYIRHHHLCNSNSLNVGRAFTSSSTTTNKTTSPSQHYDVLIVGGGVVGSSLALNLSTSSQYPLRIGLMDARRPNSIQNSNLGDFPPEPRSYALSPKSLDFLGPDIVGRLKEAHCMGFYDSMQVWESDGPSALQFKYSDLAEGAPDVIKEEGDGDCILGAIVEDSPLISTLWNELENIASSSSNNNNSISPKLDLIAPITLTSISAPFDTDMGGIIPPKPVELTYRTEQKEMKATANLLIAADGPNSFVRRTLSLPTAGFDYERKALTCVVKLSSTMRKTAYQRFLNDGPIALLPLRTERPIIDDNGEEYWFANVVWSCKPDRCARLMNMNSNEFIMALNDELQRGPTINPPLVSKELHNSVPSPISNFLHGMDLLFRSASDGLAMSSWGELGRPFYIPPEATDIVGRRLSFDLKCMQATRYVRPRVALVGDAAHVVHPLAGQGLNLGMADAESLLREVHRAMSSGMEVGSTMHFLDCYDTERRKEVTLSIAGIHAVHEAFGLGFAPAIYVRSLGVNLVNMIGPARNLFARIATGRTSIVARK